MSEGSVTIDDIYALFRESERQRLEQQRVYELEREAERQQREAEHQQREAERQQREAKRQQREAEHQQRQMERQMERQEWEREHQEWKRVHEQEMAEFRKVIAQANKQVAGISDRWGEFVENLVRPAAVRLFREQGIQVHQTALNLIPESGELEIDILAENTHEIVAIEVKSHLQARDVKRFLKTLEAFKTGFPKYQNHRLYGAVAGIKVGTKAEQEAGKAGLFLIKPAGDSVMITNLPGFAPRIW
jgi:hypothetical protein